MARRLNKQEYLASPVRKLEEGIFNEAAQGRGGGMWAGTIFGLTYGLLAGAVIGLMPWALGFGALTLTGVAGMASAVGIMGALQGRAAGSDNGSAAGAAVGSTKVLLTEMRQQFKGIKQEIRKIKQRLNMPASGDEGEPAGQEETAEQSVTQNRSGYFKWKTALIAATLGATIGLVAFGAASLLSFSIFPTFLASAGFAGAHAGFGAALIGAASGAFFAFNVPRISAKMHMLARKTINQRIFEPDVTPAPSVQPELEENLGINVERLLRERTQGISPRSI